MHAQGEVTAPPACAAGQAEQTAPATGAPGPQYLQHPRNFSSRSRHSALSAAQQETWQRLWPQLGIEGRRPDEPGVHVQDARSRPLDTRDWFGRDAPVVLEIGSGAGTSTAAMARAEPDIDVVAVEVYRRGLGQLLCAIERESPEKLGNIRLIHGDAADVLEHLIAPASLTGVRIFFPDPWPKARHHKRRLLRPATLTLIADRLRPGGVLHVATDHPGYAEQIAAAGDTETQLRRVAADPDMPALPISVVRPITKYETKARDAGSSVTELLWEKRRS